MRLTIRHDQNPLRARLKQALCAAMEGMGFALVGEGVDQDDCVRLVFDNCYLEEGEFRVSQLVLDGEKKEGQNE